MTEETNTPAKPVKQNSFDRDLRNGKPEDKQETK